MESAPESQYLNFEDLRPGLKVIGWDNESFRECKGEIIRVDNYSFTVLWSGAVEIIVHRNNLHSSGSFDRGVFLKLDSEAA